MRKSIYCFVVVPRNMYQQANTWLENQGLGPNNLSIGLYPKNQAAIPQNVTYVAGTGHLPLSVAQRIHDYNPTYIYRNVQKLKDWAVENDLRVLR